MAVGRKYLTGTRMKKQQRKGDHSKYEQYLGDNINRMVTRSTHLDGTLCEFP